MGDDRRHQRAGRVAHVGHPRGDGRTALDEAEVHAAIRRAVGADFDYEILSVMPWTRRELVADAFASGNVFLAGDSAHAMSPTGGFGMNTGVGDAVDLSWKMTAVQQGWGGGALLGSYTAERHPVALRNVTEASGNLGRMLSPPAHRSCSIRRLPPPHYGKRSAATLPKRCSASGGRSASISAISTRTRRSACRTARRRRA